MATTQECDPAKALHFIDGSDVQNYLFTNSDTNTLYKKHKGKEMGSNKRGCRRREDIV